VKFPIDRPVEITRLRASGAAALIAVNYRMVRKRDA
jgi:hypothetical protein